MKPKKNHWEYDPKQFIGQFNRQIQGVSAKKSKEAALALVNRLDQYPLWFNYFNGPASGRNVKTGVFQYPDKNPPTPSYVAWSLKQLLREERINTLQAFEAFENRISGDYRGYEGVVNQVYDFFRVIGEMR